ncbi:uncharacterized protein Lamtor5 [Venturia canescens]|uniref:uncharacterized protein Lamtor5 n=1 Tax=Venturia canescens TaxID=32260 RepID=UPI001C9CC8AC|nr:uncharacterized protein LOC122411302 [Venturia canescens]
MERALEKMMEDITNAEGVTGCVFADQAGLCLGVKGTASADSAGLIAAIADQASKLQPGSEAPTICLESDTRQCLIRREGPMIGAVYKNPTH